MSETNLEHYKLGSWYKANSVEEMRAFYMSRLPFIRDAAKKCGYAIGLHGSTKRDFDLMAMPWIEDPNTIDVLAREIMLAACGIEQSSFRWTKKPCGRKACSIPICWAEWDGCYDIKSLGCVDLSVIPHPAAIAPCEGERAAHAAKEAAWKEREKVLEGLLEEMILNFYIPEANCSCHKSPPCNDCVEYSYVREIKEQVKASLQNKGE